MKALEVRILVPDGTPDENLLEIGDEFQAELPVDFEQNGIKVHDVTYEILKNYKRPK